MGDVKRALVARLDAGARGTVRAFLEQNGYEVVEADNGVDALNLVRERQPDLVFADGVLPKLSGFELCREAKALSDPNPVPVVLAIEESDNYGRGRARAEGADLILTDPLLAEDLQDLLHVEANPKDRVDHMLSGRGGTRDRFLKELLRAGPSRNDPILSRVSDPLTGLHHKEFIGLKVEEEFKKARRYGYALAILLVDVENYEEALREHGKPVANEMLLEVAGIFLCESRDVDAAGRIDNSRFLLLLPNTDIEGARIMAERVFQQVCSRTVVAGENEVQIRASVGIAALPATEANTVDEFLDRALRAMKAASRMGGNRICAWGEERKVEKA